MHTRSLRIIEAAQQDYYLIGDGRVKDLDGLFRLGGFVFTDLIAVFDGRVHTCVLLVSAAVI